jgi:hypothetical protein
MFLAGCIGLVLVAGDAMARPMWMPDEGELIRVESAALESVLYEEEARVLVITFRNGASYEYIGVTREVFKGLLNAADKGRYYNAHIRAAYECHRIEEWASAERR